MPAFISHKFEDIAIYSAVRLALEAGGVQCWDPNKMSRGESLADQLRDAIHKCEVCVFIATSRSVNSPWCLSELGAFWGAGKRVLLFLAEPNLGDSVLPPQFKGDLKVNTAQELIDGIQFAIKGYNAASAEVELDASYDFFETSGNYGTERDWQRLLIETQSSFDIMGVALVQWRKTPEFRETILTKAENNCVVRILLMDEENEILTGLLYDSRNHESVVHDIRESYSFYFSLSVKQPNIQVRKILNGIPHFFLTKTDKHAVLIQYLSSATWGSGPTWRCPARSKLFNVAVKEFEHLWTAGTQRVVEA